MENGRGEEAPKTQSADTQAKGDAGTYCRQYAWSPKGISDGACIIAPKVHQQALGNITISLKANDQSNSNNNETHKQNVDYETYERFRQWICGLTWSANRGDTKLRPSEHGPCWNMTTWIELVLAYGIQTGFAVAAGDIDLEDQSVITRHVLRKICRDGLICDGGGRKISGSAFIGAVPYA